MRDAATPGGASTDVPAARRWRAALIAAFLAYSVLLVWLAVWKLALPYVGSGERVLKLVPFIESGAYGPSAPSEVLGNLLVFVPLGLYLGLLSPTWSWRRVAAATAATSVAIEVAQYVLAVGRCDVTDMLVNTAGGLAGFGILSLARLAGRERADRAATRVGVFGALVAVLMVAALVASPLQFRAPPQAPPNASAAGPNWAG